jgi:hypothetical protein
MMQRMDLELTTEQARAVWQLRRRHPGAEVRVHGRPWGVIVELRRHGHTVGLAGVDHHGLQLPDRRVGAAA